MSDDYGDDYEFDTEPLDAEYFTGGNSGASKPSSSAGKGGSVAVPPGRNTVGNKPAPLNNFSADSSPLSAHSDTSVPNQGNPPASDGVGGVQVDEMAIAHNALVASLTHSGVMGKIRAQLRSSMLGILKNNPTMIANNLMIPAWQLNRSGHIAKATEVGGTKTNTTIGYENLSEAQRMGLVICADFLASLDLDLTIGVLEEECGGVITKSRAELAITRPEGAAILSKSDNENRANGVHSLSPSHAQHAATTTSSLTASERRQVRAAATAALREKLDIPEPPKASANHLAASQNQSAPFGQTILDQLLSGPARGAAGETNGRGLVALLGNKHSAIGNDDPYNGNVSITTNNNTVSAPNITPQGHVVHVTSAANDSPQIAKPADATTPAGVSGFFDHSLMSLRGSAEIDEEAAKPANKDSGKPVKIGEEAQSIIVSALMNNAQDHPNGSYSSVDFSDHNSECESDGAYDYVEEIGTETATDINREVEATRGPRDGNDDEDEDSVDEDTHTKTPLPINSSKPPLPSMASAPPVTVNNAAPREEKESFEPYEDDSSEDMYGSDRFANEDEDDDTF